MNRKLAVDLELCFNPPKGKPGLRRIKPDKKRVSNYLDKAIHNLHAMKVMHNSDIFDWTIICGYYAFYHAVLAALYSIGIDARTHFCALSAFKAFFIERGSLESKYADFLERARKLEQKYAHSLDKAQESRVSVQYDIVVLQNDDADWILEEARNFVEKIEEVLGDVSSLQSL
ncbi:MAG: HEPN domain-containing protein [Deltaproteobacteria bacterium]|nr:HEPN domain-containing protein [Deltaproteobacteria bacterium]